MLDVTRERIDEWLKVHRRELSDPEFYYGVDNNEDSVDNFTDDRLKVLCVFLSPGKNRAVSNTFNALNWLCHEKLGDKVFVDNCYFPNDPDIPLIKGNIPYMFGNVSHAPITEYDLVLVACCVMPEVLNMPHLLEYSGIPLTIQEREKNNKLPLIVWGGAAASESAIILGPIKRNGVDIGNSLVDMAIYGYGEHVLPELVEKLYEYKQTMNVRDKVSVKEKLISDNVLHENIFYPEKYEWVYDTDRFTIKEIKKLDDRLPDRVRFNTIHWNDFRGFPLKAFNLTGENADSHDIMISSGCSGQSSCCAFCHPKGTKIVTDRGLVDIEEVVSGDSVITESGTFNKVVKTFNMGTKELMEVTLKNGYSIKATPCHRVAVYDFHGGYFWKDVKDLTCDDNLIVYRGYGVEGISVPSKFAEFVGRMVGDGTWNTRFSLFSNIKEKEYCQDLLDEVGYSYSVREKVRSTIEFSISKLDKTKFNWPEYTAEGKSIPKDVFRWSKESMLAFMKGLFGADGTLTKNGDISVSTKSYKLAKDVQLLLLQIGCFARIDKQVMKHKENENIGRKEEIQTLYRVFIKDRTSYDVVRGVLFEEGHNGVSNLVVPSTVEVREEAIKMGGHEVAYIKDRSLTHNVVKKVWLSGPIYDLIRSDNVVVLPIDKIGYVGVGECYDLTVENEHSFIADGILSHNCMEATVASRYEERDLDDLERDMAFVRRTAAPNTISWFSFNLNYYKHFMDLLGTSSDYFKGVTLLNERLDVVANAPEQLALAKRLGLKRFSGAIEGMGERVREKILNKNLPKETLFKAVKVVSSLGLMHFKAGLIATGQETEEDIQDFITEIDEMIRIRDEAGAHHSYQFNVTPLVIYSQIALRYLPRVTAKNSFLSVRNMQTLIKACQERNIRIKFNGRGCGTWLEQLLLDFGPGGTDWLVGVTLDKGLIYERNFGDKAKEAAVSELSKRDYDPLFFVEERPNDWIFPNDHIRYADDKLIKMWQDRHAKNDYSVPLCLKTPASLNPKCYNCGACFSPKEKANMLTRKVEDKMTLNEVIEKLSDSRHVDTVRVVAKMDPNWDIYNRESLCHYLTAQFLQESELIEKSFYAVGKTSTTWLSNNGQKGWFGGSFAWDVQLKDRVPIKEFQDAIKNINKRLKSCQILRVIPECKELPVKRESVISFIGETDKYSMSVLKDKLSMFNWDVKVAVKSMGGQLDTEARHMPELKERVLFVPKGNKILIYMSLPASINPYLVMSSILGKGYEKMLIDFRFNILDQGIEVDSSCSCGKHLLYSIMTGKQKTKCPVCEGKFILAKLVGKI